MAVPDLGWYRRLRESKLDPLALVPVASLAALPLAYVYANSYELGRADRFGIPAGMVRVDLRASLVPFLWLMFMLFCVLPLGYQIQQLGLPATLRAIAKRLRGLFFLLEVAAGVALIWQRESTPLVVLGSLLMLYVILYGIPSLLGWAFRRMRRPTRRRSPRRRTRRLLSAARRHIFGEPWARQSLRFQFAFGALVTIMGVLLLPYALGNVSAVINQKYSVLGTVTNQGDAHAIIAVYGDKVFTADVRRGVAQAIVVKNLDDVNNVEIREAQFPGLALDLCQREPDRLNRVLCLAFG